jgi:hypothetical protein
MNYRVGMNISAKRASGKASGRDLYVCSDLDREDLTSNYKFPEGNRAFFVGLKVLMLLKSSTNKYTCI